MCCNLHHGVQVRLAILQVLGPDIKNSTLTCLKRLLCFYTTNLFIEIIISLLEITADKLTSFPKTWVRGGDEAAHLPTRQLGPRRLRIRANNFYQLSEDLGEVIKCADVENILEVLLQQDAVELSRVGSWDTHSNDADSWNTSLSQWKQKCLRSVSKPSLDLSWENSLTAVCVSYSKTKTLELGTGRRKDEEVKKANGALKMHEWCNLQPSGNSVSSVHEGEPRP